MSEEPHYVVRNGCNDRRLTTDRKSPMVYDSKKIADDTIRGGEYVSISVTEYNQKYAHLNEIAEMLDGREYPCFINDQDLRYAKDNGAVIVYGASDDLIEFQGAINDEAGCYDGGTVYINRSGEMRNKCNDDQCPYFADIRSNASRIEAIWDRDGYYWMYETDIPHEMFDILDDSKKYCRGIVFMLDDVVGES